MKRNSLKDRLKRSYQDKDKGGSGQPAFDWKKVDGGAKFYKVKEGRNRINIIPYKIKTKNHPLVKTKDMEVGDLDYLMDVWIHRSIGAGQADIICPKRNFNKPCPVCEQAEDFKKKGKQKEADALKAKRMVLYNVVDIRDEEKGIQIFMVSHFLFEKELIDEARASSENGDIVDFPDIDDGKVISFRASTATFGGHEYFEFKSFQFIDRDEALDESFVDDAISFDEIMKLPSYDEIQAILFGEEDDEDEEEEIEEPKSKKKVVDDDEDMVQTAKRKAKKNIEPELDDEEGEDEKPVKKSRTKKPSIEEEDEEDEKPVKKSKVKKSGDEECPSGYKYGVDCDEKDECDACPKWGSCATKQTELKGEK